MLNGGKCHEKKWKRGVGLCVCEWTAVILNRVVREDLTDWVSSHFLSHHVASTP